MLQPSSSPRTPFRNPVLAYGIAVLAIALATANVFFSLTNAPVGFLVLAVMVSVWFGGRGPGLLSFAVGFLVLAWADGMHTGLFTFVSVAGFIVWIVISERRVSRELRKRESEMRLVIDGIPQMAWILEPDGRLSFLNRRWLDYSGLTLEEAVEGGNATMHPEDAPGVFSQWAEARAAGRAYEGEMRLRRADGAYRWFLVRTVPQHDEHGTIVRWYGTSTDIEDRKQAEQALRESAERLQHLSRRLLEVQEEERRHLARELHDEFGQLLSAVTLHLRAAVEAAGPAARPNLEQCMALLQRAGSLVRSLALELRPALLDSAGLDAALRWLAEEQLRGTGIAVRVQGQVDGLSGDAAMACFRVTQEALTNVVQHAAARNVRIELGRAGDEVRLVVHDDGAGFDARSALRRATASGHLGLLGMRERVQILGGRLEVESTPGSGTRVRACLPAAARARPEPASVT